METSCHSLIGLIFCMSVLYSNFIKASAEIIYISYAKPPGDSLILQSPHFPRYSNLSGDIYNFSISNTDRSGYVRIVFTDFNIHPNSYLKIYDGGRFGSVIVWKFNDQHPVYQSSSQNILLVFKSGKDEQMRRHDEYLGWRANIEFVTESRETWSTNMNIPSTGLCPDISNNGIWIDVDQGEISYGILPYFDCFWHVRNLSGTMVAIIPDWESDIPITDALEVSVYHDGHSQGLEVAAEVVIDNGITYHTYTVPSLFFVHIQGKMSNGQQLKVAFHANLDTAKSGARDIGTGQVFTFKCPFQECGDQECTEYWKSCTYGQDPACSLSGYIRCGTYTQCYDSINDVCDSFDDCIMAEDESICSTTSSNATGILTTVLQIIGILIFFIFSFVGFSFVTRGKLFKPIGECCGCFLEKIGDCCSCICEGFTRLGGSITTCFSSCCDQISNRYSSCCESDSAGSELQLLQARVRRNINDNLQSKDDTRTTLEKNKDYYKKWVQGQGKPTTKKPYNYEVDDKTSVPAKFFLGMFIGVPGLLLLSTCTVMLCMKNQGSQTEMVTSLLKFVCYPCYKGYKAYEELIYQQNRRGHVAEQVRRFQEESVCLRRAVATQPSTSDEPAMVTSITMTSSIATNSEPHELIDIVLTDTPANPMPSPRLASASDPSAPPPDYSQISAYPQAVSNAGTSGVDNVEVLPSYDQAVKKNKPKFSGTIELPPPTYDDVINNDSTV